MLEFFVNPWMLAGLAGVSLPILAHLFNRRRFETVDWAAIRFLNPGRRTRRRLRLQELLLLLIRAGLILLLAFAAARPWLPGGWLTAFQSAGSREVVIVIDGSNSMGRSDGLGSVHQRTVRQAVEYLDTLAGTDLVSIVDARDRNRLLNEKPLRDHARLKAMLGEISPPSGGSDLPEAVRKAITVLGRSSAVSREILIFTESQKTAWRPEDQNEWNGIRDLLQFPAVRPRLWVVDAAAGLNPVSQNIAVGQIESTRHVTVPDFPFRFRVPVHNYGSSAVTIPVRLAVNGQPLPGRSQVVEIPPDAEVVVNFEHRFSAAGAFVLSVQANADSDLLQIDNESHIAVQVRKSVPVLLVSAGGRAGNPEDEAFYAAMALNPPGSNETWIRTRTVTPDLITPQLLDSVRAVLIADPGFIGPEAAKALADYVQSGGGLFYSAGQRTRPELFEAAFGDGPARGLRLTERRNAPPTADSEQPVRVRPYSLDADWLRRFRDNPSGSFLKAEFRQWYEVRLQQSPVLTEEQSPSAQTNQAMPADYSAQLLMETFQEELLRDRAGRENRPVALATLTNETPLLLAAGFGRGRCLFMLSSLDAVWNTLPAQPDFVPFLYEAVFYLSGIADQRNIRPGAPYTENLRRLRDETDASAGEGGLKNLSQKYFVRAPFGNPQPLSMQNDRLSVEETHIPGLYEIYAAAGQEDGGLLPADARPVSHFVVNYDHAEDDPTPLREGEWIQLADMVNFERISSSDRIGRSMYGAESRSELWATLLWAFLGLLVVEAWMTHRLVRRGLGAEPSDSAAG